MECVIDGGTKGLMVGGPNFVGGRGVPGEGDAETGAGDDVEGEFHGIF